MTPQERTELDAALSLAGLIVKANAPTDTAAEYRLASALLSLAAQSEELRAENERIRLYPDEEEIIRERDSALAALEKEREENERLKDGIKIEQETRRAALTSYNFIEQNQVKLESHYTALEKAAQAVVWFDWSSNDDDAVSAITALRDALGALLDSEASQGGSDG